MKLYLTFVVILFSCTSKAQQVPVEIQIKTAVMAAPEEARDSAAVMGYDANGQLVVLREGMNELICVADDPSAEGINIACYHKDLEPFMARGRELRAEGKGRMDIFNMREEEVKAGTLSMPAKATTLHILYGTDDIFNAETGELTGAKMRWVIYIPFATAESTGLPLKPSGPGTPWLMDPGTHRAHIMVTPQN
ncbi:hypothetical protein [Fulvivirga sedimenti]|uniref:Uncharacterized protein n=1 Tax=Fulvivirga sedimenti TaxID=2879465 RepID=A0A9X1L218_9BACT|nr:hypothetical protein [Fulvivirga sedimenti]MCA6078842.1 hypothetical protein [Fulvivirga sedimenti]